MYLDFWLGRLFAIAKQQFNHGFHNALQYRDGLFDVIEFWIENRLMLELLTPAIAPKYLNVFSPEQLKELASQLATVDGRR